MICVGCKFAEWERTKTGALHPNGAGKCTWAITVKVSGSTSALGFYLGHGKSLELKGGYIDRKQAITKSCDVREQQ